MLNEVREEIRHHVSTKGRPDSGKKSTSTGSFLLGSRRARQLSLCRG